MSNRPVKKKRTAERQITKDDGDDDEEVSRGSWKVASAEQLSQRKFISVKRKKKPAASAAAAFPSFSFGNPKVAEKKEETKDSKQETTNASTTAAAPAAPNETSTAPSPSDASAATSVTSLTSSSSSSTSSTSASTTSSSTSSSSASTFSSSSISSTSLFGSSTSSFTFGTASSLSFASMASSSPSSNLFGTGGAFQFTKSSSLGFTTKKPENKTAEMFKDAKPLETGLDDDHTIFKVRCQVYRFESPSEGQPKKYQPCGVGELKVNLTTKDEVTRARMVLHAEKTHRLVLNAPIFDKMEYAVQNEKFIRFFSMNLEATMMIHMLRFKTKADALETEKAIKLCLDRISPTDTQE